MEIDVKNSRIVQQKFLWIEREKKRKKIKKGSKKDFREEGERTENNFLLKWTNFYIPRFMIWIGLLFNIYAYQIACELKY